MVQNIPGFLHMGQHNRGSPINRLFHTDLVTGTWHSFSQCPRKTWMLPALVPANERRPLWRRMCLHILRTADISFSGGVLFLVSASWSGGWAGSFSDHKPSLHPWPMELVGCYFSSWSDGHHQLLWPTVLSLQTSRGTKACRSLIIYAIIWSGSECIDLSKCPHPKNFDWGRK